MNPVYGIVGQPRYGYNNSPLLDSATHAEAYCREGPTTNVKRKDASLNQSHNNKKESEFNSICETEDIYDCPNNVINKSIQSNVYDSPGESLKRRVNKSSNSVENKASKNAGVNPEKTKTPIESKKSSENRNSNVISNELYNHINQSKPNDDVSHGYNSLHNRMSGVVNVQFSKSANGVENKGYENMEAASDGNKLHNRNSNIVNNELYDHIIQLECNGNKNHGYHTLHNHNSNVVSNELYDINQSEPSGDESHRYHSLQNRNSNVVSNELYDINQSGPSGDENHRYHSLQNRNSNVVSNELYNINQSEPSGDESHRYHSLQNRNSNVVSNELYDINPSGLSGDENHGYHSLQNRNSNVISSELCDHINQSEPTNDYAEIGSYLQKPDHLSSSNHPARNFKAG